MTAVSRGATGTAPGKTRRRVVLLPGDGIGREVIAAAAEVLREAAGRAGVVLDLHEHLAGGAAIDAVGVPLPEETLRAAKGADAVLLGAVGSPRHDALPRERRPERALLGLRQGLGVYANLRPVKLHPALVTASPLRPEVVRGTDLLIVRELTGGIYFGTPRGIKGRGERRVAANTMTYSVGEIRRIARVAFEAARGRRGKVTSVDKANILETSQLWREIVNDTGRDYPDVALDHLYVDNAAMQIVARPASFDVILTENMFGDILSDEAAMLAGGIGMLPSASLGEGTGLYEPVHGSAPDIAGRGIANPLAAILSAAMLLRHSLDLPDEAAHIEGAVARVLEEGARTADLARPGEPALSTRDMGERVRQALRRVAAA
ncbi:MAG TPA: 3-isopropylmalate dehydrogenase [Candidatus Polarisedimenticolia bacterium]|nr:3-isopropylmalate dehydrogenase [Candidatus Polarisedimenticolia bacterium]